MDFHEHPTLVLLPSARWDKMGMISLIWFFDLYMIFLFFCILLKCVYIYIYIFVVIYVD